MPRGVEGDSRGLDKENKGRGVPFEIGASVLRVASYSLAPQAKKPVLRDCNATRTAGCAAGCIRAAHRMWMTSCSDT